MNLGVPGDTSEDLLSGGPLDQAIADITARKTDSVAGNEIAVITLEIGGNDLLNLFFDLVIPGTCQGVLESLAKPRCVEALQDVLEAYEPNLADIITLLREADPDVPIFLLTLYNPFSGKTPAIDQLVELALEGQAGTPFDQGLQDIIRAHEDARGVYIVDIHPQFEGKGPEYIANDLIHPNDEGYRVMAEAVLAEMREARVIE